jgi:hypothetical protein
MSNTDGIEAAVVGVHATDPGPCTAVSPPELEAAAVAAVASAHQATRSNDAADARLAPATGSEVEDASGSVKFGLRCSEGAGRGAAEQQAGVMWFGSLAELMQVVRFMHWKQQGACGPHAGGGPLEGGCGSSAPLPRASLQEALSALLRYKEEQAELLAAAVPRWRADGYLSALQD